MDHTTRYGNIRNQLLSRHFAINKFFRTNLVADNDRNILGHYQPSGNTCRVLQLRRLTCKQPRNREGDACYLRVVVDGMLRPILQRKMTKTGAQSSWRLDQQLYAFGDTVEITLAGSESPKTGEELGKIRIDIKDQHTSQNFANSCQYSLEYSVSVQDPPGFGPSDNIDSPDAYPDRDTTDLWNIAAHRYENPLLKTGQLMVCLAVEHKLGNPEALLILRSALESLGTLYKFEGNCFDGYIIRWDAVLSDLWTTRLTPNGFTARNRCLNFMTDPLNRCLYVTPFDHPDYLAPENDGPANSNARYPFMSRYRYWEPSMDELVGLMMGYDAAFRLVDDSTIKDLITTQVNWLGNYLAAYNYMLVRPSADFVQKNGGDPVTLYPKGVGGFTWRGSMGMNPALEYPLGILFSRIAGNSYAFNSPTWSAWEDTVKAAKAGIWDRIKGDLEEAQVAALLGKFTGLDAAIAATVAPLLSPLGLGDDFFTLFAEGDIQEAIAIAAKCSDKFDIKERGEVVLSFLLSRLEREPRFKIYMAGAAAGIGGWAKFFPQYLALSCAPFGSDEADPLAMSLYGEWLTAYRDRCNAYASDDKALGDFAADTLVKAVGVVLGLGDEWERRLVAALDQCGDDIAKAGMDVLPCIALDYMTAVALAWIHFKNKADHEDPVTTPGFPVPPSFAGDSPIWPPPAVPLEEIVNAVSLGGDPTAPSPAAPILPFQALQSDRDFYDLSVTDYHSDTGTIQRLVPLFLDPVPTKPAEPEAYAPKWPACALATPPYISEVAVVQVPYNGTPNGFAHFDDLDVVETKYKAAWKETNSKSRTLTVDSRPLKPDMLTYVFLKSPGPQGSLKDETVQLTLTGVTPDGNAFQEDVSMVAGDGPDSYYYGFFMPSNPGSQSYRLTLEIQASSSTHPYLLRLSDPSGQQSLGDVLDSNPATISSADKNAPPFFPLAGYEPGKDRNHQIEIGTST